MYIVTIENNGVKTEIHGIKQKLTSGKVVKGINSIDSFSFSMLPSNAGFSIVNEFKTLVSVYNTNRNKYEFNGRVLYSEASMSDSGLITKDVTCESILGYLCDSRQAYVAEQNWTVKGLLKHIIDCHNSQVEKYKRFVIGEVTVTETNDNLYLGIQRENTWDALNEKLIKQIGGEIRCRIEDGTVYLDYLQEVGEEKATKIALSFNMKSITREQDPTAYVTRLIPLGSKIKDSEGNETEERLDITSVNKGLNYIDDTEAIEAYGIHVGIIEFDDVTEASNLLRKGKEWLAENNKVQIKYSITALDLSLLGLVLDDLEVGNYHPIENALLGVDDVARIIKKTVDVCEEVKSTIEIGDNFKTLSDIQQEQEAQLKTAAQDVQTMKGTTASLQGEVSQVKTDFAKETSLLQDQIKDLEEKITELVENDTGFTTDETLTLADGILSVNTAADAEQDNTLPITSAAVFTEIGNINTLLATI